MTFNPSRKLDRDTIAMLQHIGAKDADLPPVKPRKARNTGETTALTNAILSFMTAHGHWGFRVNSGMARALYGNGYVHLAPKGTPDTIFYLKCCGKMSAFEVKTGKDKASIEQKIWMERAEKCGVLCGIVRSIDDLQNLLQSHSCTAR